MGWYKDLIIALYNSLPKEVEEVPRSKLLEDYYNKKYPIVPIFYNGRVQIGSNTQFKVDVRDFFTLNDQILNDIVKSLKLSTQTDNQKAVSCLRWVIENIPYKSDQENYKQGEFWCMPFETLNKRSADCEDLSILLANLMIIAGIPSWKIRLVAGYVFEPIKKIQAGHVYITFFDEMNEKWVILDSCYYPNLKRIEDREEYKKEKMYQEVWFSWNDKYSWNTSEADIRKMGGFN